MRCFQNFCFSQEKLLINIYFFYILTKLHTSYVHFVYFILLNISRAEEFGQNYVRSAATSVDKSENSPQFSYIILR